MRVLLVEDEDPKRRHIEVYLKEIIYSLELAIAQSYNSAIDALEERLPDVLLLDMSLPTFDRKGQEGGGRPQGFGGIEIIRYMKLSNITCPIIIVTGYDAFPKGTRQVELAELESDIRNEFGNMVRSILYFNSAYDVWKSDLSGMLSRIAGKKD